MSPTLRLNLPAADGRIESYGLTGTPLSAIRPTIAFNRVAYAAGHVVVNPLADFDPWLAPVVDWDKTLAFREHLWSLGLGIAEAMDTAQRGMGFGWDMAHELIRRTAEAAGKDRLMASGCGTDQLDPASVHTLVDVIAAYEEQMEAIEACGSRVILMASRALARVAKGPDDYVFVYDRLLRQARNPVILHWLGPMFDAELAGYWGAHDFDGAVDVVVGIMENNADQVDGIKISLLDAAKEVALRARLPTTAKMFTGDDFNYVDLIAGDGKHVSHALLGAFDAIAPAASLALSRLAAQDEAGYRAILEPTLSLSRHIFAAPTQFYKTGVVFMAYLNGHQDHFTMVGGMESARSTLHLVEIFRLADQSGLLTDPELATRRMQAILAVRGIDQ
ncbi:dihydrodipicolinate synthase family protein [Ochrobactrum sp. S1502_03]|uniref:dihydrodipicolinate synthase family protein n=1 Tax=Ochrobactrum sp. S1502_03 TaxID=3108451 RepID=UPI0037C5BD87